MPEALFFQPWIGADYGRLQEEVEAGVLEPAVWAHPFHAMGESHYGEPHECESGFTRARVLTCGYSSRFGPCSAFFAEVLKVVTGRQLVELNREEHWNKLAFSNFIQDLLPRHGAVPKQEQWERGRRAFRAQLAITRPQILLVLSQRLWAELPRDFCLNVPEMRSVDAPVVVNEARAYVYEVAGRRQVTLAVYVIHPSAPAFKWRIAAARAQTAALYYSNIASSPEVAAFPAARIQ